MNNELGKTWKEAVLAYFKALSQHLPRRTEENNKSLSLCTQSQVQELNQNPLEYTSWVITINIWFTTNGRKQSVCKNESNINTHSADVDNTLMKFNKYS